MLDSHELSLTCGTATLGINKHQHSKFSIFRVWKILTDAYMDGTATFSPKDLFGILCSWNIICCLSSDLFLDCYFQNILNHSLWTFGLLLFPKHPNVFYMKFWSIFISDTLFMTFWFDAFPETKSIYPKIKLFWERWTSLTRLVIEPP